MVSMILFKLIYLKKFDSLKIKDMKYQKNIYIIFVFLFLYKNF